MNDTRNMILAVLLSALVLIGWTVLSERFLPQPDPVTTTAATSAGTTAATTPTG